VRPNESVNVQATAPLDPTRPLLKQLGNTLAGAKNAWKIGCVPLDDSADLIASPT
jgi:hypothetical protein